MTKHQQYYNDTNWRSILLLASTVSIVWFAVILQIGISIPAYLHAGRSLGAALVQLISYFTILANLLAAVCLAAILLKPAGRLGAYFLQSHVFTGIALYITIVGLVYNVVLRSLWQPIGWFKLADELLHTVNPLLFIIYWLLFVPKIKLKWVQALKWLWGPFIYVVYIFIRAAISHLYPYPFLNIDKLGLLKVMINCIMMLAAFLFTGLLFVWINRLLGKP